MRNKNSLLAVTPNWPLPEALVLMRPAFGIREFHVGYCNGDPFSKQAIRVGWRLYCSHEATTEWPSENRIFVWVANG
jgi:hypothetical protein